VGPKYVPYLQRPGGKKYQLKANQLERKILAGSATDEQKHEYYLITGQRASDIEA
jgi:hypothetical protein